MKNTILLIIFFFLIIPSIAHGKWHDRQGNPLEDTEWMKSSGDFGAQLLLIADENEFFKRWETPSETVHFDTVSGINHGESLITPIIFSGCYVNKSGNCMVTADLKILRPDGSTYADMPQVEVWQNKPPPAKGMLELSVGYLKVIIETEDPDGTYTVQATVTDNIKKSSVVLTRTFSVPAQKSTKQSNQPDQETIQELNQWLTYYYKSPHSSKDIENINKMFQSGLFNKPDAVAPFIMFLAEFFRQNETSIPGWEKSLHEIPQEHETYLLHALWQAHTPNALHMIANLSGQKTAQQIAKIKEKPPIDLKTAPITSPAMLDMLWTTFMASGNTFYVERIINALSLPTESEGKNEGMNNFLIVAAAKWSLASNAVQHELVFKTCQKFTDSDNPNIKQAILEVLKKAKEAKAQQSNQTGK